MNCLFFMFGRVFSIKSDKFEYNIIKTPPLKNVASKNVAIIPTSHHQNVANFQPNYWLYYIVFKGVGNWDIAIVQYRIFLYHAQIKKCRLFKFGYKGKYPVLGGSPIYGFCGNRALLFTKKSGFRSVKLWKWWCRVGCRYLAARALPRFLRGV